MSTGFAQLAAAPGVATPDPTKHVNYTLGMMLGVDDFNQEFAYLSGRDQWIARDAIGYGTLCGLRLSVDTTVNGPRISVTTGTALTQGGQLICVNPAQCAYLNAWLTANEQAVENVIASPLSSSIKLYLVVSYRDCPVDPVPIAGEPCRSADDLMAPSRLVDDFQLEFRLSPPLQLEEDAIRDFVAWMNQIVISTTGPFTSLTDFVNDLRTDLGVVASPPDPGAYFHFGSPLAGVTISPSSLPLYMDAAFRIWVTEIRPLFHSTMPSAGCGCGNNAGSAPQPADDCLLLAEVDVPLVNIGPGQNWQVDDTQPVTIDESRRPILVHTRMIQEWLLAGPQTK
jgi:hypothetical protein